MNRRNATIIIPALLVLAVGLAVSAQAFAQGGKRNVTTTGLIPLDVTVFNPVTNETVHVAGDVRLVAHTRFNSDGTVTVSFQCNLKDHATGEQTGDKYMVQIQDIHRFTVKASDLPFTVSFQCDLRLLNAGSCNDVEAPLTLEVSVAQNGTVSAKYVEGGGDQFPHDHH